MIIFPAQDIVVRHGPKRRSWSKVRAGFYRSYQPRLSGTKPLLVLSYVFSLSQPCIAPPKTSPKLKADLKAYRMRKAYRTMCMVVNMNGPRIS